MAVRRTAETFRWIISILRSHAIPHQLSGGLAARTYGVKRALADIDIGVPDRAIPKLHRLLERHVIDGPRRYKDAEFDLELLTLRYKGQLIDLFGTTTQRIYNNQTKKWELLRTNFAQSTIKTVYRKRVPVIPFLELVRYKQKINRVVDRFDVRELRDTGPC